MLPLKSLWINDIKANPWNGLDDAFVSLLYTKYTRKMVPWKITSLFLVIKIFLQSWQVLLKIIVNLRDLFLVDSLPGNCSIYPVWVPMPWFSTWGLSLGRLTLKGSESLNFKISSFKCGSLYLHTQKNLNNSYFHI